MGGINCQFGRDGFIPRVWWGVVFPVHRGEILPDESGDLAIKLRIRLPISRKLRIALVRVLIEGFDCESRGLALGDWNGNFRGSRIGCFLHGNPSLRLTFRVLDRKSLPTHSIEDMVKAIVVFLVVEDGGLSGICNSLPTLRINMMRAACVNSIGEILLSSSRSLAKGLFRLWNSRFMPAWNIMHQVLKKPTFGAAPSI